MKKYFPLALLLVMNTTLLRAQTNQQKYPTPEFSNEIYFFKKDSGQAVRLEKGFCKPETKTKFAGMGGIQNGYTLEGDRSPVRLTASQNISFIFFSGNATANRNPYTDSVMRANGMDPAAMDDGMSMNDPSRTASLYNVSVEKDERKIILHSFQSMLGKTKKESTKYTMSIKKIRNGYYELVVDKTLPKGEYAFLLMDPESGMDGSLKYFAFGVE